MNSESAEIPRTLQSHVGSSSQTSELPSRIDDAPPCRCWDQSDIKKFRLRRLSLRLVLPTIRTEIQRSIDSVNTFITLQHNRQSTPSESHSFPTSECNTFTSLKRTTTTTLEAAIVIITTAPGYVCRKGRREHDEKYAARHETLRSIEQELRDGVEEAGSLLAARTKLVLRQRRIRLRGYLQTAVRMTSIAAIPFSPLLAAIITTAELVTFSALIGIEDFHVPDTSQTIQETIKRYERLEAEIQRRYEKVHGLLADLEAIRAKLAEEQEHTDAIQLNDLLDKVLGVRKAVDIVFPRSTSLSTPSVQSVTDASRDVAIAFRDVAHALDCPSMLSGPLASFIEGASS